MAFCLKTFAEYTGAQLWGELAEGCAEGFAFDTRLLQPGELFVALTGEARDGHAFLGAARQKGAVAALVSRVDAEVARLPQLVVKDPLGALQEAARRHRATMTCPVVGVTGSCGKTSTKDLLHALLGVEHTHATTLNFNGKIGVPLTLLGLRPELHRFAVLEAGISEVGDMAVLEDIIRPDHVIITKIAPAHLEQLGTEEGVAFEKAQLAQRARGRILFHAEGLCHPALASLAPRAWVAKPSEGPLKERNRLGYRLFEGERGTELTLWLPSGGDYSFELGLLSEGQQQNAVLALALALDLGVDPEFLQTQLFLNKPSPGRGEVLAFPSKTVYLDAYNANPSAMLDALAFFQKKFNSSAPRLYIIGSMAELGTLAAQHHERVGQQLMLRPQDSAWLIGPHAQDLLEGIGPTMAAMSLHPTPDLALMRSRLAAFQGAVFIKGAHALNLESLVR